MLLENLTKTDNIYYSIFGYTSLVTSSLSVFATLSIIIPIFCKCACLKPAVTELLHISIADFLASLFMVITVIIYLMSDETKLFCLMTGHLAYTFYASSFVFIILYAAQALAAIHNQRTNGKIWRIFNTKFRLNVFNGLYCLAWIIPPAISIPVYWQFHASSNLACFTCLPSINFKDSEVCKTQSLDTFRLANKYRLLLLFSELFTLLILIVLLSVTLVQYYKQITSNGIYDVAEQKLWKKRKERVIYFIFSFVFCWFWAILLNILLFSGVTKLTILNPFYIAKSLTNPLHGFLNAIVYGWQRRTFTNIFRKPASAENYGHPNYESYSNRNFVRSVSDDNAGYNITTESISENQRLNS